jgi:hypothetical protein
MSQQQDEADLLDLENVYIRSGGEFLLGFIGRRLRVSAALGHHVADHCARVPAKRPRLGNALRTRSNRAQWRVVGSP